MQITSNRAIDVYLAQPYSHPCPFVREEREKKGCEATVKLMEEGMSVYCPIAETAALATHTTLKNTSWEFWRTQDLPKLASCKDLYILTLDGWKESKGVRGEVKFAINNGINIFLLDEKTLTAIYYNKDQILEAIGVEKLEDLND